MGCLIFMDHFAQKSPIIHGSFAEKDLQLMASYGSLPLCNSKLIIRLSRFGCVMCVWHCNALQHTATHVAVRIWHRTAVHCKMLQHTATHCSTLQHTASLTPHDGFVTRICHHTATHCNILQHVASRCNTLQNTAQHADHAVTHCKMFHL